MIDMLVKKVMSKKVISINPDDTVNKALAKMIRYKIHQLVVDEKHMLILKNVITRMLEKNTKVRNLMTPVAVLESNEKIEIAMKTLLNSGLRALPVVEKGKVVGVLSESDIMSIESLLRVEKKAVDIATTCYCTNVGNTIAKVRAMMKKYNVSRIPVLERGKVVGIVDDFEIAKIFLKREEAEHGRTHEIRYKEFLRLFDVPIRSFMRKPVIVNAETDIKRVANLLKTNEEVIVSNGFVGIITPKDIMEFLFTSSTKTLPIQIINIKEEPTKTKIENMIKNFVSKLKGMKIDYLFVHVEKHEKQRSKKTKYSVRMRLSTNIGFFVSHAWDYSLMSAAQNALDNLRKEVMKKWEIKKKKS